MKRCAKDSEARKRKAGREVWKDGEQQKERRERPVMDPGGPLSRDGLLAADLVH